MPFYDLLSTAAWEASVSDKNGWQQRCTLEWPIGTVNRIAELDRDTLIAAGETQCIKPATALKQITQLERELKREASSLMEEVEQEGSRISKE